MQWHRSFPIPSWVDLPHVFLSSTWMAFHSRGCQNYFHLLLILSISTSLISLILGTFHPRQWPPSSPCCPASKHFSFNSNPLNLALIGKAAVYPHQTLPSYPLSNVS